MSQFKSTPVSNDFMSRPVEQGASSFKAGESGESALSKPKPLSGKVEVPVDPAAWTDAGPVAWTQLPDGNCVVKQGKGGAFVSQGMPPVLLLLVKAARETDEKRKKAESIINQNTLPPEKV